MLCPEVIRAATLLTECFPMPPLSTMAVAADGELVQYDTNLDLWLAELRSGDEARVRRRQFWLERVVAEQATFVGMLTDLTEGVSEVVLETTAGRRHTGLIRAVGHDFCAISEHQRWTFVALRSLAVIRSTERTAVVAGSDRPADVDLTLLEALADQLDERPRVVVWLDSGERVQGELASVGQDLVSLRVDGEPPRLAHVCAAAITEVGL